MEGAVSARQEVAKTLSDERWRCELKGISAAGEIRCTTKRRLPSSLVRAGPSFGVVPCSQADSKQYAKRANISRIKSFGFVSDVATKVHPVAAMSASTGQSRYRTLTEVNARKVLSTLCALVNRHLDLRIQYECGVKQGAGFHDVHSLRCGMATVEPPVVNTGNICGRGRGWACTPGRKRPQPCKRYGIYSHTCRVFLVTLNMYRTVLHFIVLYETILYCPVPFVFANSCHKGIEQRATLLQIVFWGVLFDIPCLLRQLQHRGLGASGKLLQSESNSLVDGVQHLVDLAVSAAAFVGINKRTPSAKGFFWICCGLCRFISGHRSGFRPKMALHSHRSCALLQILWPVS